MDAPLQLAAFDEYMKTQAINSRLIESTRIKNDRYTVQTAAFDNALNSLDKHTGALKNEGLQQIQNSPYIDEAYQILLDYITLKKQ